MKSVRSKFAKMSRSLLARRSRGPLAQTPLQRVLLYSGAVFLAVFTLFPFYWALISAFRDPSVLLETHSLLPGPFSLENIRLLLEQSPFVTYTINSAIVATSVTALTLLVATPVAYILSRVKSRLASFAAISILAAYMVPEVLLLIPIYIAFVNVYLDNTLIGVIIALLALTTPLGIWLMLGFLRTLPYEIEEAAFVDGATWLQVFRLIVLPIARPGLPTVGIFSFIFAWVDYLVVFTLVSDDAYKTLPVGIASLFGTFKLGYGQIMAGILLMTLPIFVALMFVSRYFISGLTMGATKG